MMKNNVSLSPLLKRLITYVLAHARVRARVFVRVNVGDIPAHCLLLFACVTPPREETRNGEMHGIAIFASYVRPKLPSFSSSVGPNAPTSRKPGTGFRALVKYDLKRTRSPLLRTCLVAFFRDDGTERRPGTCEHFRWLGSS